ncbi:MAG: hypothetical protein E7197_05380 [Anaerovibrio sp.]|uniref:AbiJ-NTD4 domain-containing protein n=1 Tax=Anaerovibrio sp. TaxID=1872532 RepID=UPI0025C0E1F1|nr:hypothetical protein [Anaerovibrio sp.]MBE6099469.1 hypothetical protein [Anaerovibrio sp.]
MAKVSVRGGFSDRNNIKAENKEIQIKNFDQRTRIQFNNMVSRLYRYVYDKKLEYYNSWIQSFIQFVRGDIYSECIDVRKYYKDDDVFSAINDTIMNGDYADILTIIEKLVQYWDAYLIKTRGIDYYNVYTQCYKSASLYEIVNEIFEREYVGYRFIDKIIVPISDLYEVGTIEEALNTEYDNVYEHISKANKLLSDRERPDYENSIKESISAVEAMCQIIIDPNGNEATLGNMLKKLENNGIAIHGALKSAFEKLYGYTSDANGIRHAGDIGGPSSTFEEAKFMLVSCCAFINYLIAVNAD